MDEQSIPPYTPPPPPSKIKKKDYLSHTYSCFTIAITSAAVIFVTVFNVFLFFCSNLMKDVVKLLGGDGPDVQTQLDNILNFEILLANVKQFSHFFPHVS